MTATEKAIRELKDIGYTDGKIKEVLTLLLPEVADQLLLDLASQCSDEELEAFEARLNAANEPGAFENILQDMAKRAYGDSAKEKMDATTAELLDNMKELTLKMRETYRKYMTGDPNTRNSIKEIEKSPEYKQMLKDMEKDGFDFLAQAAK